MEIKITKDYQEMSELAAKEVAKVLAEVKQPVLGLATGSTPVGLYEELSKMELDFSKTVSVNLDEYIGLDGNHPQSYRYFMNEKLFNHINIDKKNTYVPDGSLPDAQQAARDYEELLSKLGRIDLQILGIGNNGHIGFNEPDRALSLPTHVVKLEESTIEANARFFDSIDEVPKEAITMGVGSIFKAKKIIVLASGKAKASIIKSLVDEYVSTELPASLLKFHPNVLLIIDQAAASLLD